MQNRTESLKVLVIDDEKPVQDFSILGHAIEKAIEKMRLIKENQAEKGPATEIGPDRFRRTEKIMLLEDEKDIPVILHPGFHETISRETAFKAGFRRYVQKPVTGKELAFIIREELDSDGRKMYESQSKK